MCVNEPYPKYSGVLHKYSRHHLTVVIIKKCVLFLCIVALIFERESKENVFLITPL